MATSKVFYDKEKHSNSKKNEQWQPTCHPINPFTIPFEADETKLSYKMPLVNESRINFTSILLTAYDTSRFTRNPAQRPEWVPKLSEITRVLGTEYDKINFAFMVPHGFAHIKGI